MEYYNRIKELAARNREAKTQEEKEAIAEEMMKMQAEDPEKYQTALETLIKDTSKEMESITMSEKLGEVTKIVSMAYIAQHYFGKTRSWLAHKLNGNTVNGKKADFTTSEIETLKFALSDISNKLGSLSTTL